MPNNPGATPQPHQLRRVVPVAQARALDGGSLTIVSLELYVEGFLVHTQVRHAREQAGAASTSGTGRGSEPFRSPEIVFAAVDDRGGSYGCWAGGGYGGGGLPGEMLWRRDYVFAPAPPADARELRLSLPAVEWLSYDPANPRPTVETTQPVGWTLTVPLA
jgi:hypothetical protein